MLMVIENLLSKDEVARIRQRLDAAEWRDGASTAGAVARRQKRNLQIDEASEAGRALGAEILRKVEAHPLFISAALPRRIHPPRFNRYEGGGTYGAHVDSALMRLPEGGETLRSDVSATVFLSEPEDYDGGELEIEGPFGAQVVKLAAGEMVIYPSSSLHRVTPVTRGARIAAFLWAESFVPDEAARTLLFDLDQSIQGLATRVGMEDVNLLRLTQVYHNLLRRWAKT
jgi:PKHD-type hydroxylase